MSSWRWHGAYVQSKSQVELVEGIQETMSQVSRGTMHLMRDHFDSRFFFHVGEINLLFVSPQQENWTAFFGAVHGFCAQVFETCHYSGLLIGGMDRLGLENHNRRNSWNYIIWKDGIIIDWFVSNLSVYFDINYWTDEAIIRIATLLTKAWFQCLGSY